MSNAEWFDLLRTLAGSLAGAFVGASLAFLFNGWLQYRAQRRDEKAAGNYAMATLTRQYNGFLNVKQQVVNELERCRSLAPEAPEWFSMAPQLHFLRSDLDFDFARLTFLFEQGDVEAFQELHQAEAIYRTLLGQLSGFSVAAAQKQEKLSSAGIGHGEAIEPGRALAIIGPKLASDLAAFVEGLKTHVDRDERHYLSASKLLHAALEKRFGKKGLIRIAGAIEKPDAQR